MHTRIQTHAEDPPTGPAMRTRIKTFSTTQEAMLSCFNIHQISTSACAVMSLRFSKEVLAEVLNEETGELMEYLHLIRNPKYRELWQK